MKTFAFRLTRHTTSDPLTVQVVRNELGILPKWVIDAPGVYRAVFDAPIGFTPKQVITIHGDAFHYLVVEGNGLKEMVINAMIADATPLEADLVDCYCEVRVLDQAQMSS